MERATKLGSRSKRNNLIFYNIPELWQESSTTTETLLHQFLEQNLDKAEGETKEIPIEQAHRLGKVRASLLNLAFRKIKSAYYQAPAHWQEQIMAFDRIFRERESGEIRKGLVKVMKQAKKEGQDTKLVYDKLYINGKRYKPSV